MHAAELIERKRDGGELSESEIRELVLAYTRGEVPDYQMAAFMMAVYFRDLSAAETHALTDAFIQSGDVVDLSVLGRRAVDKHSTGGVGDKTSIALGPIIAACDVPFAKMSGRGLGHTGGTLDKLESIEGLQVELDREAFLTQVRDVGMAIIGQTADLVPADKRLYALRDVTATVDNNSLIAASIMSKKIAAGADAIVLDVKVGDGAFMRSLEGARELARTMIEIGERAGRDVVTEITDMDQPLGRAVGNALEVQEAADMLKGQGPPDFTELVLGTAGQVLALSDLGVDADEGRVRAERAVESGAAHETFERWIAAQGGDPDLERMPTAAVVKTARAQSAGFVSSIATGAIGRVALHLGAGRATAEDVIDHSVGLVVRAKRGDRLETGDLLVDVHSADEASAERAVSDIQRCYEIGTEAPEPVPIVLDILRSSDA